MEKVKEIRVSEYAKAEGISVVSVYKRIKAGKLKSRKVHGLILVNAE